MTRTKLKDESKENAYKTVICICGQRTMLEGY